MKRSSRIKLWLGGASALALGAWAFFRRPTDIDTFVARAMAEGNPRLIASLLKRADDLAIASLPPVPKFSNAATAETAPLRIAALRKARPDADPVYRDGYSSGTWFTGWDGGYRDEYGRRIPIKSTSGLNAVAAIASDALGPLLDAAGFALPYLPGIGTAGSAALATAIAVGKGKSIKNIALDAARASVPGGMLGQMAFDVGVAAATGKDLTPLARRALLAQVPDGYQTYATAYVDAKRLKSEGKLS